MYMSEGDEAAVAPTGPLARVPFAAGLALGLAAVFTVVVGFLPSRIATFSQDAVPVVAAPDE
jgi:hypothetical protein